MVYNAHNIKIINKKSILSTLSIYFYIYKLIFYLQKIEIKINK